MKKNDKKKVIRSVNVKDAAFIYLSVCCTAPASKPACAVTVGTRVGRFLGDKPEGEATLGGWRCGQCRKPCKVTRSVNPKTSATPGMDSYKTEV